MKVIGTIISDVQKRDASNGPKTTFTLGIAEVQAKWGWQTRTGKVLVNIYRDVDVAYGDRILLEGRLHYPFNFSSDRNFSYRDYLSRRDIQFILSVKKAAEVVVLATGKGNPVKAASLRFRQKLNTILYSHLSRNEAGIMSAILLGDRSAIPRPVRTLFVHTGTAHILAISGLHVGIVAALFLMCAKILPIGRRAQLTVVIILIIGYAFLTGGRPSVVRAAVMTVVFLGSFIVEREFDIFNTLCLAAVVILLANPFNLYDVGFQLSFTCVGAIIYADVKMRYMGWRQTRNGDAVPKDSRWDRLLSCIKQSFFISLTVWASVAGLIAYYFGIVTPVTVLANLIVVPFISVIVALGFGLITSGVVLPSCAGMFAVCLKAALNLMAGLIYLCDQVPYAHIYIRGTCFWHVMAYYVALIAVIFIPWRAAWPQMKLKSGKIFKRGTIDKHARV
jgi:competence protein ComEC